MNPAAMRESEDLCRNASTHMQTFKGAQDFHLSFTCAGDEITMTGTVARPEDIPILEREVLHVPGVARVVNLLRTPPETSDAYLASTLRSTLEQEDGVDFSRITYTVKDGIVHFKGHVKRHEDIDKILSRTLMIEGVRDVKSAVTIGQ